MKRALMLLSLVVSFTILVRPVSAQTGLNPDARPVFGSVSLAAGLKSDPIKIELESGGPENIRSLFNDSNCTGFTTSEPSLNIYWSGSTTWLSLLFIGDDDTSLVIKSPDNKWYCSADSDNTDHPRVTFNYPSSGTYNIWIGGSWSNSYWDGNLYISESSHSVGDYLSTNGSGSYSSSGSSSSSASSGNNWYSADDRDGDGITNDLELFLAESFVPVYEYDEEEHNPVTGSSPFEEYSDVIYLYQVSPVKCGVNAISGAIRFYLEPTDTYADLPDWIRNSTSYLLTVVAAYPYDYLPYELGPGEKDILSHYGDTERVQICIVEDQGSLNARFVAINRHHDREFYDINKIDWYEGSHPYLFVSEGKHATFTSESECEESVRVDPYSVVTDPFAGDTWQGTGWDEDCGGGETIWPYLKESLNVGEYHEDIYITTNSLNNDNLTDLYPWEYIWSPDAGDKEDRSAYFCGGYDVDDFAGEHTVVSPNLYKSPWCGGSLDSKWWRISQ